MSYKIPHVSGWQKRLEPYDDCYGVYKFAHRDFQGYVQLSKTNPFTPGSSILRHRWVYQNEKGEIPQGFVINHLNRIRGDDHPENLVAMSKADHSRKHRHELKSGKIPIGIPML